MIDAILLHPLAATVRLVLLLELRTDDVMSDVYGESLKTLGEALAVEHRPVLDVLAQVKVLHKAAMLGERYGCDIYGLSDIEMAIEMAIEGWAMAGYPLVVTNG